MNRDGIVFVDADDTLWENNRWFQRVIDEWSAMLAHHGIDPVRAAAALHATEDRNIPLTGYGAGPFVRSAVETFHALVPHADHATRDEMAAFARRAESSIRDHPIELLPGVAQALPRLAGERRLVVMTKGDDAEQRGKFERSGIARWFAAIHVVAEKRRETYEEAARRFGAAPERCWMIGNSPASDVNPALAAGMKAVHVPHPAPWHRDAGALDPRAVVVRAFGDVIGVILGDGAKRGDSPHV